MPKIRFAFLLFLALLLCPAGALRADVKTQEKTLFKFEGMIGRMAGLFGGKEAREGVVSTIAVKGNRKAELDSNSGEIIDLDEERIYRLDIKKKSYQVITFEELRRQMREAQKEAEKAAREQAGGKEPQEAGKPEKEMEVDFSLRESGQRKAINGHDCREVIMTVTFREKGKTLEESGGLILTSNTWLTKTIPALKEINDFDLRYAEKLGSTVGIGASAEQMAMIMGMYPGMKDVLGRMQVENVNLDGTAVLTQVTMEGVKGAEEMAREQASAKEREREEGNVGSLGGLGGLLGRKIARKAADKDEGPKARSTIFTSTTELMKVFPGVADSEMQIPAGFKEKK